MNILFVDQFSEPGGAQLCLMDLLPEVRARGWNALLAAPGEGELVRCYREFGIPIQPLPIGTYANGGKTPVDLVRFAYDVPRMRAAIRGAIARHGIDVVYVNGPRVLVAVEGAVRGLACPVIFHAHSPVAGNWPRKIAEGSVRRMSAHVIAVSKFVALRYPGGRVIYNGVPDFEQCRMRRAFRGASPARWALWEGSRRKKGTWILCGPLTRFRQSAPTPGSSFTASDCFPAPHTTAWYGRRRRMSRSGFAAGSGMWER